MAEKIVFAGGAITFFSFAIGGVTVLTPLYKYAVCGMLVGFTIIVSGLLVDAFKGGEK